MRRPHPRFDTARDAWVTRAGGTLKILAKGPKNAETEAAAWDAFYAHMVRLGQPVEVFSTAQISLGELADRYGEWMRREVETGRMRPATLSYYQHHVQHFLDTVGGRRPALSIPAHEVEMYKTSWHSIQAIQRLYNWGVEMGLLKHNPFAKIKKPDVGQRQRILSSVETVRLLRAAAPDFRLFLFAMRHTIARPQEVRAFQWKHLTDDPTPMFVLTDFKGKNRRKMKKAFRRIPLDDRMLRLLTRLNADFHGALICHTAAQRLRCFCERSRSPVTLAPLPTALPAPVFAPSAEPRPRLRVLFRTAFAGCCAAASPFP